MKKLCGIASIGLLFSIAAFCEISFAQNAQKDEKVIVTVPQNKRISLKTSISVSAIPTSSSQSTDTEAFTQQISSGNSLTIKPNASAPALSSIFISEICSDTVCEDISSGQAETNTVFTGSNIYIAVWEIGYGSEEIATQGGTTVASKYLLSNQLVCLYGTTYYAGCPQGGTAVGNYYEWNVGYYLSNYYGQNFTAKDTSIVSPYNTLSTSIFIQYSH